MPIVVVSFVMDERQFQIAMEAYRRQLSRMYDLPLPPAVSNTKEQY